MPGQELRLLALDGGGVRGLSSLIILEQLMETIDSVSPPKPCDYFDMIGGTSTGGLIAVMLGRLKLSISECIDAYLALLDRVFQKKRHRVTTKGSIQGRFDSEELAKAVKEVVAGQGTDGDTLLKDVSEGACKVFVCATSKQTSETVCLTSYKSPRVPGDLWNSVKIWEACRATSAASSFFDPIAIGRFGEEFVDGGTGANNPVWEVWNQAQLMWGPEPLEDKIKCLVSIGTGTPLLKPFQDEVLYISQTLAAIATETEQTAERFRRDKMHLDNSRRYYRFNVIRGLEDIGLEESKKRKEIAAATRRYVESQDVYRQIQACADSIAGREYFGSHRTTFSLESVPKVKTFVERSVEMAKLEGALLPQRQSGRQKVFILHGLGGIGKTQLAVEFARTYHRRFSAVFWLDGRSEESLKRSVASCASRIAAGQISQASRSYATGGSDDLNAVITEVMGWLAQPDNTEWLLIIDNVDREYNSYRPDPDAYDVKRYFSGADHGAVLVTTRLATLEQLGASQQLGKVNKNQAAAIFQSWYKKQYDPAYGERLLRMLDGLPLAIAQAGAYLQQSGVGIERYIKFYDKQWKDLMKPQTSTHTPLKDYQNGSVGTTWIISYNAVRETDENTANLLLLWALLDNRDLWHGLFSTACKKSSLATRILSRWIGNIANNELNFSNAMLLLRNYSLIEDVEVLASYATHPVVHRWMRYFQSDDRRLELAQLAVVIVGWAVPDSSSREYSTMQRRLLPHAQICSRWVLEGEIGRGSRSCDTDEMDLDGTEEKEATLDAVHLLGLLYADQGKLAEAEKMYERALDGKEKVLGPEHTSTLQTVNNLGNLYADQGKLAEAEKMYERALDGKEKVLGPEHISILNTVNNLGNLYANQGKLAEAEKMYERALDGKEKALGPEHTSTLDTVNNLGNLYKNQGKLAEAEKMYERALDGREKALGPEHISTLQTVNNLGNLYADQGKLAEAEKMYERALDGREKALGPEHISTLDTVNNLGNLYADQGKLAEAEKMYERALDGREKALGPEHTSTLQTVNNLGLLYANQGKLAEAEKMYERALDGYEKALGPEHISTLQTVNNLGNLYADQGKLAEAEKMYERALDGKEKVLGPEHISILNTVNNLGNLYANQGKLAEAEKMYERALDGKEKALGPEHTSTLDTVNNLGNLYADQGKLAEAEKIYQRFPGAKTIINNPDQRPVGQLTVSTQSRRYKGPSMGLRQSLLRKLALRLKRSPKTPPGT
ncbi:hypothetical protein ACLMJK_007676 [Lecanora helva]